MFARLPSSLRRARQLDRVLNADWSQQSQITLATTLPFTPWGVMAWCPATARRTAVELGHRLEIGRREPFHHRRLRAAQCCVNVIVDIPARQFGPGIGGLCMASSSEGASSCQLHQCENGW
jgi:hypothetical protein